LFSLLTGGLSHYGYRMIALGGVVLFLALVIPKSAMDRAFATLRDNLLDGLETNAGLIDLRQWLSAAGDLRRPLLLGLLIFTAPLLYGIVNPEPVAIPVGMLVMGEILLLSAGFVVYYMLLFVVLPLRLSRCQFKLHVEDPVSTEVLSDWFGMMNYAAYMFALALAAGTLWTVAMVPFRLETLFFIIPNWLPLIALFVTNQLAMSGVVTRSKRKTLNEVEAQMEALRPSGEPPDHETMETLLWLWDYHDRIKGTRSSVLDVKGIVNLVNTLLIPTVAFLLANRSAIVQAVSELTGRVP
jgi:hypothetical protein